MNQQEFKEEIFENREAIKERFTNIYDSKKLARKFFAVFKEIDYITFNKMSTNEQQELIEKVFGNTELVFGGLFRDELEKANNLANKRLKTKSRE